jgi:predicted ATPase
MALTARAAGAGVDIIEHPEAELHPAAHGHLAELLLENLAGPARPLVVETHSEMVLLRARRWIAEGRLPAADVLIYWVHAEPRAGSILQKIRINKNGELDRWPDGVFIEDYEEILAIRRAARANG